MRRHERIRGGARNSPPFLSTGSGIAEALTVDHRLTGCSDRCGITECLHRSGRALRLNLREGLKRLDWLHRSDIGVVLSIGCGRCE